MTIIIVMYSGPPACVYSKCSTAEEPPNHGGRGRQSYYEVWQCSDLSFRIRFPTTITGRVFLRFPRRISFGPWFVRSRLKARLWFGSVSFMSSRSERRRRLSDPRSWNAIYFGIDSSTWVAMPIVTNPSNHGRDRDPQMLSRLRASQGKPALPQQDGFLFENSCSPRFRSDGLFAHAFRCPVRQP